MQSKYDPTRSFESVLFSKVKAGTPYTPFPKCATTNACYCSADEHCAPGFECVPAISLPQYKICRAKGVQGLRGVSSPATATAQEAGAAGR